MDCTGPPGGASNVEEGGEMFDGDNVDDAGVGGGRTAIAGMDDAGLVEASSVSFPPEG